MSIELTQAAEGAAGHARASTRCSVPGRCAARSSARSRTSLAEKMLYGEVGPGQIVAGRRRGRGPEAAFTFTGHARSPSCPTLPPIEPSRGRTTGRVPRPADRRRAAHRDLTGGGAAARVSGTAVGRSGRQGVRVVGDRTDEAVVDQAARQRVALRRRRPTRRPAGAVHRLVRRRAARRAAGRGTAGRCRRRPGRAAAARRTPDTRPRATRTGRPTGQAPHRGRGRRADQGAELHHRDRPGRPRSARPRAAAPSARSRSARVTDGAGELHAGDGPGQDPAHVGVEHGVALPEREGRDRGGGVVADAGQRPQRVGSTTAPRRRARSTIAVAAACRRSARRG